MSRLFEWGRWVWCEAELSASPMIQRTVMPRLHEAKEVSRLLLRPYLIIYQWQGQGQGGPLTVSYAGLGYASPFLQKLLFTEEPSEREICRIPVWNLSKQVDSLSSDLTIIEASKYLTRKLPRRGSISLPFRVYHSLDVQREWKDLRGGFRETTRKNDLRRIRKYGYECTLSRSQEDLEMFYHTMYVPTTAARHGQLASIDPIETLYQYFRHGFLLLIKRDGRIVSGGLCSIQQKTVSIALSGVINSNRQLRREGAVAAIHYSLIRWANEEGYQTVNLGACWPFLNNGIFQYKRKWGATVAIPSREHKRIWIRIQRDTPAVRQYMKDNPCVVVGERGELQGLVVTDNLDSVTTEVRARWQKRYATPGLHDLLVRSIADFLEGPVIGESTGSD